MACLRPRQQCLTYSYDGDGKRLQASSGSQATNKTNYLWDPNAALPMLVREADGRDNLLRKYVYGTDLVSMTTGAGTFYYHHDPLGSVANLTSGTGSPQWTYTYEPFGTIRTEVKNDPSAPTNLMRFTGEYFDADTGSYHLRARQYDSATGRFLTRDPLTSAQTDPYTSTYVYADNAPTILIDPSGLEACVVDRSAAPAGSYWDIRSHMSFWDRQAQAGLENPNAIVGFFQWGTARLLGGSLAVSGLDTVQASAETLGTPCTSGWDKMASVANIALVGTSWYGASTAFRWYRSGREFVIGPDMRIAPFGNRGPGRWHLPHYHHRMYAPDGSVVPGQGLGQHRPWQAGW
jgi:RHS repeat-associated protein